STNVVPNPGFEQAGCGDSTPIVCGWELASDPNAYMSQDTTIAHSGSASLYLSWSGEATGFGFVGVSASTNPPFCAAIGPGAHAASFWYANVSGDWDLWVSMDVAFYPQTDCTGTPSFDSIGDTPTAAGWGQVTGALVAPPGTQSALFSAGVGTQCPVYG